MNCTARLAVLSSLALLTACSKPAAGAPLPGTPTPAAAPGQTPKADAPVVPATNIPKAPHQDATVLPTGLSPAKAAGTDLPANPTVADLGKLLGTITDGPTATAAKSKIETIITSLKSAASAGAGALGGDLTKLAGAAAEKAGVDVTALKAAALKQVDGLLNNDAIKGAIGTTLEQLKTLLK